MNTFLNRFKNKEDYDTYHSIQKGKSILGDRELGPLTHSGF